jgi:hypothetical protein
MNLLFKCSELRSTASIFTKNLLAWMNRMKVHSLLSIWQVQQDSMEVIRGCSACSTTTKRHELNLSGGCFLHIIGRRGIELIWRINFGNTICTSY